MNQRLGTTGDGQAESGHDIMPREVKTPDVFPRRGQPSTGCPFDAFGGAGRTAGGYHLGEFKRVELLATQVLLLESGGQCVSG